MLSLLGLGAVVLLFGDNKKTPDTGVPSLEDYQDNYIEDANRNKEIVVEVKENFAMVSSKKGGLFVIESKELSN